MHDAIIGERLGLPSVGIMTSKFTTAAELMARVLGAEDYSFLVIDHPISSAAPDALAARARLAVARAEEILLGANGRGDNPR